MNFDLLHSELTRDEGVMLTPYTDTVGKITIGIGHNLTRGISRQVADYMLSVDTQAAWDDVCVNIPWYDRLSDARQRVLANMCFNMGISKLLGFTHMLDAMKDRDFNTASDEMLDSQWARQVGGRAARLAKMVREG